MTGVKLLLLYSNTWNYLTACPVVWGSKIHRLHLCRRVRPPTNACLGYDTKQYDGEAPVLQGLLGMRSTPSVPLIPGPLCPGGVTPDGVLSMS